MIAIVSGVVVILMGIWVGVRGTRNFACRIPDRRAMKVHDTRDMAGSLLVSMGYALGCTATPMENVSMMPAPILALPMLPT